MIQIFTVLHRPANQYVTNLRAKVTSRPGLLSIYIAVRQAAEQRLKQIQRIVDRLDFIGRDRSGVAQIAQAQA